MFLNQALAAIRFNINESSKFSPYFLVYNRDVVLPIDNIFKPRRKYQGENLHQIALQEQHKTFTRARQNMIKAKHTQAKYADRGTKNVTFEVNDPVFYKNNQRKGKLDVKWKSYFRIIQKKSPTTYVIKSQLDGHTCKVHAELLRPAKINDWQIPKSETGRPIRKAAYVIPSDDSERESLSESENEVTSSNLQNESDQIIQKSELDIRSDRSGDVSDQDLDLPLNKLAEKYRRERAHSDYEDNIPLMELAKRFKARTERHKLEQLTEHKSGNSNSELKNKPKIKHNSGVIFC